MSPLTSRETLAFAILALLLLPFLRAFPAAAQSPATPASTNFSPNTLEIPRGTILPARITHGFSSKNARPGQRIAARIMQDVPLPGGRNIPEGATLTGAIVAATPSGNNLGGTISLRFDQLEAHHVHIPVTVNLRALASFMEVEFAGIPDTPPGFGTPSSWVTTNQIGGDVVYGVGGEVTNPLSQPVGKAVFGGVLVHVRARPGMDCRGSLDDEDRLQALWLFSADACGLYGFGDAKLLHAGRTSPAGVIVLAATSGELKIRAGSGMLVRVITKE